MVKKSFTAQVDDFVKESEQRMNAVVLVSVQTTINIAQNPTAKGGLMRVDTGFLRASGQVSFDGMPTGSGRNPTRRKKGESGLVYATDENYVVKLAGFKLGATIFWGWVADYAEIRNAYDGFLDNATAKWQSTVANSVAKLKARLGK